MNQPQQQQYQEPPQKKTDRWKTIIIVALTGIIILLVLMRWENEKNRAQFWMFIGIIIFIFLFLYFFGQRKDYFKIYKVASDIRDNEANYTGANMPLEDLEVVPIGVEEYALFWREAGVSIFWNMKTGVVGREKKGIDTIREMRDKSEIARTYALREGAKKIAEEDLERKGFDVIKEEET